MIKLHHDYIISINLNITKKLAQQFVEFFKVIQKIENLAYKFDTSNDSKFYSERLHIVLDVFSRLFTTFSKILNVENEFDALHFTASLIGIDNTFKKQIINEYIESFD